MKGRIDTDNLFYIIMVVAVISISVFLLYTFLKSGNESTTKEDCNNAVRLYCTRKYSLNENPSQQPVKDACTQYAALSGSAFDAALSPKCRALGLNP